MTRLQILSTLYALISAAACSGAPIGPTGATTPPAFDAAAFLRREAAAAADGGGQLSLSLRPSGARLAMNSPLGSCRSIAGSSSSAATASCTRTPISLKDTR